MPLDANESGELNDALRWLLQVDGRLMRKDDDPDAPDGWIAIVKTPAPTGQRGRLILGFGSSPLAAVETAQASWDDAWQGLSTLH